MPEGIQNFDLIGSHALRGLQCVSLDVFTHALTAITYGGALWVVLAILFRSRGYKLLALQIIIAIVFGIIETSVLKHIFHRARPTVLELYEFWLPMHRIFADTYSFPSGHTVLGFAAAGVIFYKFRDSRGWLALLLALVVGIARVYEGRHWPTDVIVGIFVGLFASVISVLAARKFLPKVQDSATAIESNESTKI